MHIHVRTTHSPVGKVQLNTLLEPVRKVSSRSQGANKSHDRCHADHTLRDMRQCFMIDEQASAEPPNVCSTRHLLGSRTKPLANCGRRTISTAMFRRAIAASNRPV